MDIPGLLPEPGSGFCSFRRSSLMTDEHWAARTTVGQGLSPGFWIPSAWLAAVRDQGAPDFGRHSVYLMQQR